MDRHCHWSIQGWNRQERAQRGLLLILGPWAGCPVPEALDGEVGCRAQPHCKTWEDPGVGKGRGIPSILREVVAPPWLQSPLYNGGGGNADLTELFWGGAGASKA